MIVVVCLILNSQKVCGIVPPVVIADNWEWGQLDPLNNLKERRLCKVGFFYQTAESWALILRGIKGLRIGTQIWQVSNIT